MTNRNDQNAFPQPHLRRYTNVPFEIFIIAFTVVPFFVLAYFYTSLPAKIPLFMSLSGEVAVWTEKTMFSVFRVPLLAVDTQLICFLMKYATVKSVTPAPLESDEKLAQCRSQYLKLNVGLYDWFRCLVAFKMSAASLDTIFLSIARFQYLARPAFAVTVIAALLSIVGALFYGYRLYQVRREMKEKFGDVRFQKPVDANRVYGGIVYFNPSDSALFVSKHLFNFANKWVWVLFACVIAYPLIALGAW